MKGGKEYKNIEVEEEETNWKMETMNGDAGRVRMGVGVRDLYRHETKAE